MEYSSRRTWKKLGYINSDPGSCDNSPEMFGNTWPAVLMSIKRLGIGFCLGEAVVLPLITRTNFKTQTQGDYEESFLLWLHLPVGISVRNTSLKFPIFPHFAWIGGFSFYLVYYISSSEMKLEYIYNTQFTQNSSPKVSSDSVTCWLTR